MYSRKNIIDKVHEKIEDIDGFYQAEIINITGETSDTSERINDVVAEELLKLNIKNKLAGINEITRANGYYVKSHNGKVTTGISKDDSNRHEERFALDLFNMSKN